MILQYERNHDGAWIIYSMAAGYLVTRTYYGYTLKQATKLYKQYIRETTNDND